MFGFTAPLMLGYRLTQWHLPPLSLASRNAMVMHHSTRLKGPNHFFSCFRQVSVGRAWHPQECARSSQRSQHCGADFSVALRTRVEAIGVEAPARQLGIVIEVPVTGTNPESVSGAVSGPDALRKLVIKAGFFEDGVLVKRDFFFKVDAVFEVRPHEHSLVPSEESAAVQGGVATVLAVLIAAAKKTAQGYPLSTHGGRLCR